MGWSETETHHFGRRAMGFARLNPSYGFLFMTQKFLLKFCRPLD